VRVSMKVSKLRWSPLWNKADKSYSAKMVQGYVPPLDGAGEHTETLVAERPCHATDVDRSGHL
jgi:hypothetical protein